MLNAYNFTASQQHSLIYELYILKRIIAEREDERKIKSLKEIVENEEKFERQTGFHIQLCARSSLLHLMRGRVDCSRIVCQFVICL